MSKTCSFVYPDKSPCRAWSVRGTERCRHHTEDAERASKRESTLLERVVWDALKSSRCPASHRYQGPGKSLPCRWCRTAHAIMLVLIEVQAGNATAVQVIADMEKQLGWTLADPVQSGYREPQDKGCSVCQRKPGEPKTSWCRAC